jgi:cytochrome c553
MQAVVGALSEAELDELARWYASMPRNGLRAAPEPAAGTGG